MRVAIPRPGAREHNARIWDAATGKEIAVLRGDKSEATSATYSSDVLSAAFSPDGARIVTALEDGTARIWDAATSKEITILRGHESAVFSAAFSPDGSRIVTASKDKTARIWDTATGQTMTILRGHANYVLSAAFSPDGTRIVTASGNGVGEGRTARIWDVHFATMLAKDLVVEVCTRRLRGFTTLTRDEMRLAGYTDDVPAIDVCAEMAKAKFQ